MKLFYTFLQKLSPVKIEEKGKQSRSKVFPIKKACFEIETQNLVHVFPQKHTAVEDTQKFLSLNSFLLSRLLLEVNPF